MSKSLSANTHLPRQSKLGLALIAGGLVAGCSGGNEPWTIDPEGYDGISEETFPLLQDPCTINTTAGTMTLPIRTGETLYLTLRATDSMVVAGAQTGTAGECAVPSSYKIAITENGTVGTEKVFLDYINGTFALGSPAGSVVTPGMTLALGAGSSLVVRGSSGVDKIYLGSTYTSNTLTYSWINVNGDTSPDVRFTGITDVKISTGVGADIVSADGGNGTTGVALDQTIGFSAYGGPDADTLTGGKGASALYGGDGDDKFVQTATVGPDDMNGGKGFDTVDYSVRTAAVSVTVCSTCDVSDVCGCVAADTSCRASATAIKTSCDQSATSAKSTCDGNATSAKSTCDGNATSAKSTCDGQALSAYNTCLGLCTQGDTTCTGLCDSAYSTATGTCTSNYSTASGTCTSNYNTATGTCTSNYNTTTGACASTQTSSNATCDATMTTCQTNCTRPLCSVCTADDGAATEGDTVNDDVEIVLGGKAGDSLSAFHGVCSDGATNPTVKCTLKGNEGDDTLIGSSHVDQLDGGAGNDTLQGGLGDDTLIGGAGVDTVSYADRTVAVRVTLDSANPWAAGQNGASGENDSIASDVENLTGGSGADSLRGNAGANIIHGGVGADTIEGGAGNDALYGDLGADALYAGAGNDLLVGGDGADSLYGGDGDDFIDSVDSSATADTIECDGQNDVAGTAGTAAGTADALVKDSSDVTHSHCDLL
jgi:Ca2+-binding RTX toxin-like protein